jgi:2-deoxy-D-gluconate 3-dehydrogenase
MMKAIVTGGSGGIGTAIVERLTQAGYEVEDISRRGSGTDLTKRDDRAYLLWDEIDLLVNCAGNAHYGPAANFSIDDWDYDLELNLTATFELCQQAARLMIPRGKGKIINIASIAGIQGTRGIVAYSVAKAGVIELTKCLSNEWAPHGIQVNCIAPGYIMTPMLRRSLGDPEHSDTIKGRIPAGDFGAPDDIANAVIFLASDKSNYITGQTLVVDGGWMAR